MSLLMTVSVQARVQARVRVHTRSTLNFKCT